jgi:hypothetical protein
MTPKCNITILSSCCRSQEGANGSAIGIHRTDVKRVKKVRGVEPRTNKTLAKRARKIDKTISKYILEKHDGIVRDFLVP